MKIATFVFEGVQSWGIVIENPADGREWVYEPAKLEYAFEMVGGSGTNGYFRCLPKFMPDREWPKTVKEFLEMGEVGMERLKKLEIFLKRYMEQSDPYFISCVGHPIDEVRLRAPVPDSKLFFGLVSNSPSFFRSNPMRTNVNIIPQGHQRPMTAIIGSGETFIGELVGNVEMGIVIGKHGDTLDSIQYLTSLAVNGISEEYVKVNIDTENYRQKRYDTLVALSERLAQKVAKTGRKHTLDPMNPYERRIIHANLQSNEEVTTFSIGQEPFRKVVIAPKDYKPYQKRGYGSSGYSKRSSYGGYKSYESTSYEPSYSQDEAESEE